MARNFYSANYVRPFFTMMNELRFYLNGLQRKVVEAEFLDNRELREGLELRMVILQHRCEGVEEFMRDQNVALLSKIRQGEFYFKLLQLLVDLKQLHLDYDTQIDLQRAKNYYQE